MKAPAHSLSVALSVVLMLSSIAACSSTATNATDDRAPTVPLASSTDRPQSAYVATVRMLETLDALRDPRAEVRLRAIESDSLSSRRGRAEVARVILDLTVLARDFATAEAVFEELERALGAEAAAVQRVEEIAGHRIDRTFHEMDWSALRVDESAFDELVSISRSVRLEVRRGLETRARASASVSAATSEPGASDTVEHYIRSIAGSGELGSIGPVEIHARRKRLSDERTDIRYRIRPQERTTSLSRLEIGAFLHALESHSPAARITHLNLSPFQPGTDVRNDEWTFVADMTIRVVGS